MEKFEDKLYQVVGSRKQVEAKIVWAMGIEGDGGTEQSEYWGRWERVVFILLPHPPHPPHPNTVRIRNLRCFGKLLSSWAGEIGSTGAEEMKG
jgi:hypothetical protein